MQYSPLLIRFPFVPGAYVLGSVVPMAFAGLVEELWMAQNIPCGKMLANLQLIVRKRDSRALHEALRVATDVHGLSVAGREFATKVGEVIGTYELAWHAWEALEQTAFPSPSALAPQTPSSRVVLPKAAEDLLVRRHLFVDQVVHEHDLSPRAEDLLRYLASTETGPWDTSDACCFDVEETERKLSLHLHVSYGKKDSSATLNYFFTSLPQ